MGRQVSAAGWGVARGPKGGVWGRVTVGGVVRQRWEVLAARGPHGLNDEQWWKLGGLSDAVGGGSNSKSRPSYHKSPKLFQ